MAQNLPPLPSPLSSAVLCTSCLHTLNSSNPLSTVITSNAPTTHCNCVLCRTITPLKLLGFKFPRKSQSNHGSSSRSGSSSNSEMVLKDFCKLIIWRAFRVLLSAKISSITMSEEVDQATREFHTAVEVYALAKKTAIEALFVFQGIR